jgi:hypothetical protein
VPAIVPAAAGQPVERFRMESDRAQLSALATTLDDVTRRVVEIADNYRGSPRDDIAFGIDQVERSLNAAARQLAKTMRSMRG